SLDEDTNTDAPPLRSPTSLLLNHVWIAWGTRGVFQGNRRVVLQCQVDDVLLGTENYFDANKIFRIRAEDLQQIYAWQDDLNTRLPAGSAFKLEFAFNGNGILENASSPLLINVNTESTVALDYKKVPGTGTNRWPASFSTAWTGLTADPLFAFLTASQANQNRVNWVTHTFTHENLDDATTYDVTCEIQTNVKMAQQLGLVGKAWWSPNSIVTPQISGLFNGDTLAALTAQGLTTAVGDNSRANLVPADKYQFWRSNTSTSNYNGYTVIPRSPTEVYYTSDTVDQNVQIYNTIYGTQLGTSTWAQILERENARVIPMLLGFRHDPHMFHQANLRNIDQPSVTIGSKTGRLSILQQWVENVLAKYTSLVSWPVQSMRMDDLAVLYRDRLARETCSISTSFTVTSSVLTTISISTVNACKVGVTLPLGSIPSGTGPWTTEKIGNEPMTVWVNMAAGSTASIPLTGGVAWA
ncbi:hypothetical protein M427DRAFT_34999, partial [Gonapodya prolifera JEL478]